VGKATCKSPRDHHHHRMWKAPSSPKGLGEVEQIDKEEVSIKMIQSLERFMRAYPAVWSESSLQHLLVVQLLFPCRAKGVISPPPLMMMV
jgi:hypothetical protein